MKSNKLKYFIIALAFVALGSGIFYFATRKEVAKDTILITYQSEEIVVPLDDLTYEYVKGELVNGKGETKAVEGDGIALSALLTQYDITTYSEVKVEASDAYQASISYDEVQEVGRAYLLKQEESGVRLVVFKDENSKRAVTDLVKIIVE